MKQLSKLMFVATLLIVVSCQNDSVDEITEDQQIQGQQLRFVDGNVVGDGEEDKDLMFDARSEDLFENQTNTRTYGSSGANVDMIYAVIDADRGTNAGVQPTSNFWWSESPTASDYNDPTTYFAAAEGSGLEFTEYNDGTANLTGTTYQGTCAVTLDVWFKDRKTWEEWQAIGGGHKAEGTAGIESNPEDMYFYVIDSERSVVTAIGGDCAQEGTFGLTQRPDPNDPNTPNYGTHVGPGGANWDSNIGANGISTWGWLTDPNTGERLWLIDFNFRIEAECYDCIDKVTDLTFEWEWYNPYRVRIYQRYENTCYAVKVFDQVVQPGEEFSISGANHDGSIGRYAYVYVGNCYYTKFRTDCALNIGPGYQRGVIEVVDGKSSGGGDLCEYEYSCYW